VAAVTGHHAAEGIRRFDSGGRPFSMTRGRWGYSTPHLPRSFVQLVHAVSKISGVETLGNCARCTKQGGNLHFWQQRLEVYFTYRRAEG